MESATTMVLASATQGTVELHARIFARSYAMVKANVSMVRACAWPVSLAWTVACQFVALAMVIATSQTCASATKVGQAPIVVFQCPALTQSAQVMVNVIVASVNASLDGRAQFVKIHLSNVTRPALQMAPVIVQLVHAHVMLDGVATTAQWVCPHLLKKRQMMQQRRRRRMMP
jgi:hypothetical protein